MGTQVTIGGLAKAVGVKIETVRYYERRNLLHALTRKPSGYRLYGDESVRRLRFIKNAQVLGFTLQEIADLLNLRITSRDQCGDVRQRAHVKLAHVENKIRDLQRLARALRSLMRSCKTGGSTNDCPILKSLEETRRSYHGKQETIG